MFYINAANEMIAARVETDTTFRVTDRTSLFTIPAGILFRQGEQYPLYDVAQGDERFIMFRAVGGQANEPDLIRVTNWVEELEERVGN